MSVGIQIYRYIILSIEMGIFSTRSSHASACCFHSLRKRGAVRLPSTQPVAAPQRRPVVAGAAPSSLRCCQRKPRAVPFPRLSSSAASLPMREGNVATRAEGPAGTPHSRPSCAAPAFPPSYSARGARPCQPLFPRAAADGAHAPRVPGATAPPPAAAARVAPWPASGRSAAPATRPSPPIPRQRPLAGKPFGALVRVFVCSSSVPLLFDITIACDAGDVARCATLLSCWFLRNSFKNESAIFGGL